MVEEGDLIEIDIPARKLAVIGANGERKTEDEMEEILRERRKNWQPKPEKYQSGVLKIFSQHLG